MRKQEAFDPANAMCQMFDCMSETDQKRFCDGMLQKKDFCEMLKTSKGKIKVMGKKDTYDDISTLLRNLKSDIEDTLMDEVLDEVKDIELKHIEEDVFSVYSPSIYKRRLTDGIDDPDNIVGKVHNISLEVDNVTEFNDDYGTYNHGTGLADLINEGEKRNGSYYDYLGEFTQPRPFIDNTIDEIEQTNSVEGALAKGLKKRNYDVV